MFQQTVEKVLMDDYRRTLFAAWKRRAGFDGDFADFLIDCFDEFMQRRGVDLELVWREKPEKAQRNNNSNGDRQTNERFRDGSSYSV